MATPSPHDAKAATAAHRFHFARDIATAQLLLARGARVDARDEDHESTPAQWLIGEAPGVARFLVEYGAERTSFWLPRWEIARSRKSHRSKPGLPRLPDRAFAGVPPIGHKGRGGTIYQWTLAFNFVPTRSALRKGHPECSTSLIKGDTTTRLLVSCVLARKERRKDRRGESRSRRFPSPVDHELVRVIAGKRIRIRAVS